MDETSPTLVNLPSESVFLKKRAIALGIFAALALCVSLGVIVYLSPYRQSTHDEPYQESVRENENIGAIQDVAQSTSSAVSSTIETDLKARGIGLRSPEEYQAYLDSFTFSKYEIRTVNSGEGPTLGLLGIDESGQTHLKAYVAALSKPANDDWAVYYWYHPGTDAGAGPYLGFNSKTGKFKWLKTVSSYIETWYPDSKRLSPDGLFMLSAYYHASDMEEKNGATLYLLNLLEDSATPVHTLAPGESFVESFATFGGAPDTIVEWVDETTIRYSVYKKLAVTDDELNTLLRTETFNPISREVVSSVNFRHYSYPNLGIGFVVPIDWKLTHASNPLKFIAASGISFEMNYLGDSRSNNISQVEFKEKYTQRAQSNGFSIFPDHPFPVPGGSSAYFGSEKDFPDGSSTLEIVMLQAPRVYTITLTSPVSMKGERDYLASAILRGVVFLAE